MSEQFQLGQHPDADLLSAFAEDALPAHERQQMLAHLAGCADCRTIVSLSLPPVEEVPELVAVRRPWFYGWNLAWPAAAAVAALAIFALHLHKAPPVYAPTQMADTRPPAFPSVSAPPLQRETGAETSRQHDAKPETAKAHSAAAPKVALSEPSDVAAIENKQVTNLPINGRNTMALRSQKAPLATNGELRGSMMGGAAGTGLAQGSAQGAGLGGGVQAYALTKPQPLAAPPVLNFNRDQSAVAAAPAVAGKAETQVVGTATVDVSAGREIETVNAATSDSIALQKVHKLPSHLAIVSTIARAEQMLAVDAAGALFVSADSGRHWKAVSTPWTGRAVKVELTSLPALARQNFEARSLDSAASIAGGPVDSSSALTGTVMDASGAAISGASVVVTDSRAAVSQTVKTDRVGKYIVSGLAPGSYQITAVAPGFETLRTSVPLGASQQGVMNLTLAVGQISEAVTVQSETTTISSGSAKRMSKAARIPHASEPAAGFAITTDSGERWTSSDGKVWSRN